MKISNYFLLILAALTSNALSLTITASSGQGTYNASYALDAKMDTRWASESSDDQWLQIIFGQPREIVGLNIHWETAYGRDYDIQLLTPDGKWTNVNKTRNSDGGIDAIYFGLRNAAGLKLIGLKRGTGWGYSIWDIDLLGKEAQRTAQASSQTPENPANLVMDGLKETFWKSNPTPNQQTSLELTSPQPIDIGGLSIQWAQQHSAPCQIQSFDSDSEKWLTITNKKAGVSNAEDIFFKTTNTSRIRLLFPQNLKDPVAIAEVQFKQPSESWTPTRHFEMLAQRLPDGTLPGWLKRVQTFWTVTGLPGSFNESLLDEYGKIESGLRNFSATATLIVNGQTLTAQNFTQTQSLMQNWAPIPSVKLTRENLTLTITANTIEPDTTIVLYELTSTTDQKQDISLLLSVRPLPINPPWQHGGYVQINSAQWFPDSNTMQWNGNNVLTVTPAPDFAAVHLQQPLTEPVDISEILTARTALPNNQETTDSIITAGLRYDYQLKPNETKTILAIYPNQPNTDIPVPNNPADFFNRQKQKSFAQWQKWIGNWNIELPEDTFVNLIRSNLAYLLINADGPATQPGSRNYNSSWIRDGAISATALIRFGVNDQVTQYINWFTDLIKDDGFVPFLVHTKTGEMEWFAQPWHEHDSFGEYIFLLRQIVEITDDLDLARRCWPKARAALKYMENLIDTRRTDQYRDTEFYGILPESNSHEGYFPGRHSYWDDFFALKGLQDAQALALKIDEKQDAQWLKDFEIRFRTDLLASIQKVRQKHNIAYLPGCAELGDLDPTSTSIGIMIADERDTLPADAVKATYDTYMASSRDRAARPFGTRSTYTPYEVRNISALIRLGRIDDAIMLADYFAEDAVRPLGWNHMAEVVHGDPRTPSYIGDMPHTWVGAGLINALRDMIVYEERGQLVLAAAISDRWLDQGIKVENLQTWYGPISYQLKRQAAGEVVLDLKYAKMPPNGFRVPEGITLKASQR